MTNWPGILSLAWLLFSASAEAVPGEAPLLPEGGAAGGVGSAEGVVAQPGVTYAAAGFAGAGLGEDALWERAYAEDWPAVIRAFEAGADPNTRSQSGMSMLMLAIQEGQLELAKLLIAKGSDVNAYHPRAGCTALILAAEWLQPELVDLLLAKGAQAGFQTKGLWTAPLKIARLRLPSPEDQAKRLAILTRLLASGAKPNAVNGKGRSALHLAIESESFELLAPLLQAGGDLNLADLQGITPLMMAAQAGQEQTVAWLLQQGATMEGNVACSCSPLMLAAEGGHLKVAEMLLTKGAAVDEVNDEGTTPLMLAAKNGHGEMVSLLLKHGAKVNTKDKSGATARLMALEFHRDEVERILQEAGGRCF
ncbi:MAG: ankyrin repeat domain-containing protein [Magnetococcales bacterium]|nr:ankyrin repeat domain-containing protein [Magnetococcales bacterium]